MAITPSKKTLDDKAILSLYQSVLPHLYFNPEKLDIIGEFDRWLRDFIDFHSFHAMMDDSQEQREGRKVNTTFIQGRNTEGADVGPLVSFQISGSPDSSPFETDVKVSYEEAIAMDNKSWPDLKEIHYFQLRSNEAPKIVVGFFRRGSGRSFTATERELFARLEPHILLVFRCALSQHAQSQAFHYFDGFARLASRLAEEHKLSASEIRLIPDLLFGYSNEEIAEREFISVPTVKSHIQHILKKTGTKNRHDLIGKFFTSPEHVQL